MTTNLNAIRQRDAECGETIPDHWQGPNDRRQLLSLIDAIAPHAQYLLDAFIEGGYVEDAEDELHLNALHEALAPWRLQTN